MAFSREDRKVTALEQVLTELRQYEHPLVVFDAATDSAGAVELIMRLQTPLPGVGEYRAPIHPRDLSHSQFHWSFQKFLYDCLHDYLVEMFTRNPQQRGAGQ